MHAYEDLERAWKELRAQRDVSVREVACVRAPRTLLVAECGTPGKPVVALAAGMHGDEPAAPWALLSIVRDELLDPTFAYRIWPCTNPSGSRRGTRENEDGDDVNRSFSKGGTTPEARAIITANRDRKFVLSLDMHEDYEASGFYCYEPVVGEETPFSARVVAALDDAGLPVQSLDDAFDLGYPQEAGHLRTIERGRVLPDVEAESRFYPGLPYGLFMLRGSARRTLTFESPRRLSWDDRIAMHRVALVAVLDRLRTLAA